MKHWSLIHNQPLLKTIFTKAPIISYKKKKSLKDTLVRAKIYFEGNNATRPQKPRWESVPVCLSLIRFQKSKQDFNGSSLMKIDDK